MHVQMEEEREVSESSDRELLFRHGQGDPGAFGVLYDRHAAPLLFYLHSFIGDASLAEDLLQEAFLRLAGQDPGLLQESARGLLYTIARNLAVDEARRSRIRQRSHPRLERESGAGPDPALSEALSRSLEHLPEEQREVLTLKFHARMTFLEIARLTGVPEPTVKSRYRYAIGKLAELMSEK